MSVVIVYPNRSGSPFPPIADLADASTPLDGTEKVPVLQGDATVAATTEAIADLAVATISPATGGVSITPSDTVDIEGGPVVQIHVGTTPGSNSALITVMAINGSTSQLVVGQGGRIRDILIRRVMATGTDSGITGLKGFTP